MSKRTWTAFCEWKAPNDCIEEIDVVAETESEARALAQKELDEGYIPGGVIIAVEPLSGWVVHSY